MSWKASAYVKELTVTPAGERITRTEKIFLLVLADYHDERSNEAWPSVRSLAEDALLSPQRVKEIRSALVRKGVLTVSQRPMPDGSYSSNRYTFTALRGRQETDRGLVEKLPVLVEELPALVDAPTGGLVGASTSARRHPYAEPPVNRHIEPPQEDDPVVLLVSLYENEIGTITPAIREKMLAWCEERPPPNEACLRYAFSQAAGHNGRSWSYVDGILRRLQAQGWPADPASMSDRKPSTAPVVATAHRI